MLLPFCRRAVLLVLLVVPVLSPAGVISPVNPWTVGSGITCEFGSIQAALDAAAATSGAQTIRVTRSLAYAAQTLVVSDTGEVTLEGGYSSCSAGKDSTPTALAGGASQSVLRIVGPGFVTLRDLTISGGGGSAPPGGGTRYGGGVLHAGSGMLTVENVSLRENLGVRGSGLAVVGTGSLTLLDSAVSDNAAVITSNPEVWAVWIATTAVVSVLDTTMLGNRRGVWVQQAGLFELVGSTIGQTVNGTGLVLNGDGYRALRESSITTNPYGGVDIRGSGDVEIDGTSILDNGVESGGTCTSNAGLISTGGATVLMSGARIAGNCGASGGGVFLEGGALVIEDSVIETNRSYGNGGGIHAIGEDTTLRFGAGVVIDDNEAVGGWADGGGIFARGVDLDLADAPGHVIRNNRARSGAGLYLEDGEARIGSGLAGGSIRDNVASGQGGGIYVGNGGVLWMFTTDPDVPAGITGNVAGLDGGNPGAGGGIATYADVTGAKVYLFDVALVGNRASYGGAAFVPNGFAPGTVFCMGRASESASCADLDGALPGEARSCADPAACNRIAQNEATSVFGGAALLRASIGSEPSFVRLVGARVVGNTGRSVFTSTPGDASQAPPSGTFEVFDSVIAGNTATNALFDGAPAGALNFPTDSAFAMGPVAIDRCTIAGNSIGANHVIGTRLNLRLHESIVYQPFATVHGGNPGGVDARSVIVESGVGMPVRADVVVADPMLADAVNGDVRLLPGSPAIDFSDVGSGGLDVDGVPRGQDAPGVPSRFGLRDVGAHEVDAGRVFGDGFEGEPVG